VLFGVLIVGRLDALNLRGCKARRRLVRLEFVIRAQTAARRVVRDGDEGFRVAAAQAPRLSAAVCRYADSESAIAVPASGAIALVEAASVLLGPEAPREHMGPGHFSSPSPFAGASLPFGSD